MRLCILYTCTSDIYIYIRLRSARIYMKRPFIYENCGYAYRYLSTLIAYIYHVHHVWPAVDDDDEYIRVINYLDAFYTDELIMPCTRACARYSYIVASHIIIIHVSEDRPSA